MLTPAAQRCIWEGTVSESLVSLPNIVFIILFSNILNVASYVITLQFSLDISWRGKIYCIIHISGHKVCVFTIQKVTVFFKVNIRILCPLRVEAGFWISTKSLQILVYPRRFSSFLGEVHGSAGSMCCIRYGGSESLNTRHNLYYIQSHCFGGLRGFAAQAIQWRMIE
jgi:hypothetical protein